MIIFSLFAAVLVAQISCSNKILIVSEAEKSAAVIKLIRDQSQQFKIEEIKTEKMPNILSADNEPLYHSIYHFKSNWNDNSWSASQIASFVQNGGNFLTTSADNKLLNEFGMEGIEGNFIGSFKAQWNSQHSFSTLSSNPDSGSGSDVVDINVSLPSVATENNFAFKLKNDPKSSDFNPLIQSALSFASGSAICPKINEKCQSNSQSISLFATLESRKGSRFAVVSSSKLFNNLPESFIKGVIEWLQKSKFNFKIASISHELSESILSSPNRGRTELESTVYRVKDRVNIRMCLVDASSNERFIPENASDFQFELKMMNIQLRKSFDSIDSDGCLNAKNVQLPGKPAIYTLQINHNRPGWSQLNHNERLLVRPYRHDEFPRFLKVAVPYYASWLGLLVASYLILLPGFFKQLK